MSQIALNIDNISKQYRLGEVGSGTLSHDLNRWWHRVRGKEDPYLKVGVENDRASRGGEYVWALKDVNFDVKPGEVLGVIGKNGAGKSTLLKVLSQVTKPTTGSIKIKGRLAALLEVGTGFHPDLTGRENIFLNGAILGMTKKEIERKLDEIIDFSGVAKYVDTPVKRYSSGMMVRLGFAVAAHLEPEILIVDEVLAVGDAEFQKKCLGKMQDVSSQGRTIFFVSHNMASIKALCTRGILMKNGKVEYDGDVDTAVVRYMNTEEGIGKDGIIPGNARRMGTGEGRFTYFAMLDDNDAPCDQQPYSKELKFIVKFDVQKSIEDAILDIRICSKEGVELTHSMNKYNAPVPLKLQPGEREFMVKMENTFHPGAYTVSIGLHYGDGITVDYLENIYDFNVLSFSEGAEGGFVYNWKFGNLRLDSQWLQVK